MTVIARILLTLLFAVAVFTTVLRGHDSADAWTGCGESPNGWPYTDIYWRPQRDLVDAGWRPYFSDAASKWTYAGSNFAFYENGVAEDYWTDRDKVITYDYYSTNYLGLPYNRMSDGSWPRALTFWSANNGSITNKFTVLNMEYSFDGNQAIWTTLHEFGHWVCLADNPPVQSGYDPPIMHYSSAFHQQLFQDEKNGVASYYWAKMITGGDNVGISASVSSDKSKILSIGGRSSANYWKGAWGEAWTQGSRRLGLLAWPYGLKAGDSYYVKVRTKLYGISTGTGYALHVQVKDPSSGHHVQFGPAHDTTVGTYDRRWVFNHTNPNFPAYSWSNASESWSGQNSERVYEIWYNPGNRRIQWGVYNPPANGQMCSLTIPGQGDPWLQLQAFTRASGDEVHVQFEEIRIDTQPFPDWWWQGCNTW